MPLTPVPTDDDYEDIREAGLMSTVAQGEAGVAKLTQAQWDRTRADVEEWKEFRDKYTVTKNGLLGANKDPGDRKMAIRNRIRERFGLFRVDYAGNPIHGAYTCNIPVEQKGI